MGEEFTHVLENGLWISKSQQTLQMEEAHGAIKEQEISSTDQKIVDIWMQYSARDPARWATNWDVAKKLDPKDPMRGKRTLEKHLKAGLIEKVQNLGVPVRERTSWDYSGGETVRCIEPADLIESPLRYGSELSKPKTDTKLLVLSETGMGTSLFSELTALGLGAYLEHNNIVQQLDATLLNGALPFIPDSSNFRDAQYKKLLGKLPKDYEGDDLSEEEVENLQEEGATDAKRKPEKLLYSERMWARLHMEDKSTLLSHTAAAVKGSLETILGEKFTGRLITTYNQEDKENIRVAVIRRQNEIKDLERQKQKKKREETRLVERESDWRTLEGYYSNATKFVQGLAAELHAGTNGRFKQKVEKYFRDNKDDWSAVVMSDNKRGQELESRILDIAAAASKERGKKAKLQYQDGVKKMRALRDEQKKKKKKAKSKLRNFQSTLKETREKVNELDKAEKNFDRLAYHHNVPSDAIDVNRHDHEARKEYKNLIAENLWDGYDANSFDIHDDHLSLWMNGHYIMSRPNMGDGRGVNERDLVELAIYARRMSQKGHPIPDLAITSHGKGGARVIPLPKNRERMSEQHFENPSDMMLVVKAPTMHSEARLEYWWHNHQTGTRMHKRWNKGQYFGSGAMIFDLNADGTQDVEIISNTALMKMGRLQQRLDTIEAMIEANESDDDATMRFVLTSNYLDKDGKKPTSDKVKKMTTKALQQIIASEKEMFKREPMLEGEKQSVITSIAHGESHYGANTAIGRFSAVDIARSYFEYIMGRETIFHMMFCLGDNAHGNHNAGGTFKSALTQYMITQDSARLVGQYIMQDTSTNNHEKMVLQGYFAQFLTTLSPQVQLGIQLKEFEQTGAPIMAEKILDNGGKLFLVNGNHVGCSNGQTANEADLLALTLDREYRYHKNVHTFTGRGEYDGRGDAQLDDLLSDTAKKHGWSLGWLHTGHSMKGKKDDNAMGMFKQTNGLSLQDTALVVCGHLHTGLLGIANDIVHVQVPGWQSQTPFLAKIGIRQGFRGGMTFDIPTNPYLRGSASAHFAPVKVLAQKYMQEQHWAMSKIVGEYLPRARQTLPQLGGKY